MSRSAGGNSADPPDLAVLLKGLYERVARQLDLDPYYVSRVARGEFPSRMVEDALRRELERIKSRTGKKRGARHGTTRKKNLSKKSKRKTARNKKGIRLLSSKPPRDPNR